MKRLVFACLLSALVLAGGAPSRAEEEDPAQAVRAIQPKIDAAIDKGVLRLLALQQSDGSWGAHEKQYQGGMTALALYTLQRSGVPATHPAVRQGIRRLLAWDPQETYSVACEILALEATQDPRHRPRLERLLARLLAWQRSGWGYPHEHAGGGVWRDRRTRNDLSNTQFAAMALRAARHAGLAVPAKAVRELIRETRFHQEPPKKSVIPDASGRPVEVAGFGYLGPSAVGGRSKPTGSMTCAGIAVLRICKDMLGARARPKELRQIDESVRLALTWLERRWSVTGNPNAETSWKTYYLYGVERVGSLLDTERIGDHPWYLEGARELIGTQKDDGSFGDDPNTCFALLFLVRATGQGTGKPPIASVLGRYASDAEKSPLRVRAEGHSPLTLWVTSFDDAVISRHGRSGVAQGLRIERVEYLVDGEVVGTIRGNPASPWRNETFRLLHHFHGPGTYQVKARAHLVAPDAPQGATGPCTTIDSEPLAVGVRAIWPPWAEHAADWSRRNLLRPLVTISASSMNADWQNPERVADGVKDGFWICATDDAQPTLHLKLKKAVKANTIVFHPTAIQENQRGTFDRATRLEVVVNDKGAPHVLALDLDSRRPTALRLERPERVKRLEIRLVDRLPGSRWRGQAGFSEIALELDPVAPPTYTRDAAGLTALACPTAGAAIHYTLDGAVPTEDAPVYTGPVAWPEAGRLHAVARLSTGETSRMLIADLPAADGMPAQDRSRWKVLRVDSEQLPGHPFRLALDGDPRTFWHTRNNPATDPLPHEIVLDLGESWIVEAFTWRARHEGTGGNVKAWSVYVSADPAAWGPAVGNGAFENVKSLQTGRLMGPVKGRYVRIVLHSETGGRAVASCAELDIRARRP